LFGKLSADAIASRNLTKGEVMSRHGCQFTGQSALRALDRQVARNRAQPHATARNAVQPNPEFGKTNPPTPPGIGASPAIVSPQRAPKPNTQLVVDFAAAQACDAMQRDATRCDGVQPNSEKCKTKPPSGFSDSRRADEPPLTPRQLAAARLIAAGRTVVQTARELGIDRSTAWRWTRQPAFSAELRRLHEIWSRVPATVQSRPTR
jgi:hypothetical protein